MYKVVFAITYKPDAPRQAMWDYWNAVHGPLVLAIPGLVKYVQSEMVEDLGGSSFDGLAELYFEDKDAYDAAMASVYWHESVVAAS